MSAECVWSEACLFEKHNHEYDEGNVLQITTLRAHPVYYVYSETMCGARQQMVRSCLALHSY